MVHEEELSIVAMHRICKKAGAERVSGSASVKLAKILDGVGVKIGKEALDYAMHAGRRTVKGRDIKIAAEKIMNRR